MIKVLLIGMLDSVHLFRWISQFEGDNLEITLFPSKKFKFINPELLSLIRKKNSNIKLVDQNCLYFYGFKEYFYDKVASKFLVRFSKKSRLAKIINKNNYSYIHAIEIQGAGYLLENVLKKTNKLNSRIIVTNLGSDIFHFQKSTKDIVKIKNLLQIADYYSAECERDYNLAKKFGFKGKFLTCNPNAGGFKQEVFDLNIKKSSQRNLIVAKCYGSTFGLGKETIFALGKFLNIYKEVEIFLYSVTEDLYAEVEELSKLYPGKIKYRSNKNKLSAHEMNLLFSEARIYVGASISDGVSTSFLESLVLGPYPIQTNTSCANEWVKKGFQATLVKPNSDDIFKGLCSAYNRQDLEKIRISNKNLALKYLNYNSIKKESLKFYSQIKYL